MNILQHLRERFSSSLSKLVDSPEDYLGLILPSQGNKFGDYQANCAMPLAKKLGKPPREIAQALLDTLKIDDICETPEIAGPGFINLKVRDDWLTQQATDASADNARQGIAKVDSPRTFVLDYSGPNVAKPMHVGHIRSTVIGDSLYKVLKFLGHKTISDNHLGDWGTQFGMILFGYKNFLNDEDYKKEPVEELGRLYKQVNLLVEYHATKKTTLPKLETQLEDQEDHLADLEALPKPNDAKEAKKVAKKLRQAKGKVAEAKEKIATAQKKIEAIDTEPMLSKLAAGHPNIGQLVLDETAGLHSGDPTNKALWKEFLPPCLEAIEVIYRRLGVTFDQTLGESFFHDKLADVVHRLTEAKLATESEGAKVLFLEGFATPMIVQKKDGAFLYATTDLATIDYRVQHDKADAILYVVDHRQSLHFEQLFAAAKKMGYDKTELVHIKFGTVLGEDNKPYKTRSGDAVGLSGLLDKAVEQAYAIVSANNEQRPEETRLSESERREVAGRIGIGAIKYADLAHNRESDYVFSYDKMLAMNGNTAAYMQYSYARVQSIFAKGKIGLDELQNQGATIRLEHTTERALALEVVRFAEALERVVIDYRPNHLTSYLFSLASSFSSFYDACSVQHAPDEATRQSRLLLCELVSRTLKRGLNLLGIEVVERM